MFRKKFHLRHGNAMVLDWKMKSLTFPLRSPRPVKVTGSKSNPALHPVDAEGQFSDEEEALIAEDRRGRLLRGSVRFRFRSVTEHLYIFTMCSYRFLPLRELLTVVGIV